MATSYLVVLAVIKLFRVKSRNARIALLLIPLYKSLMMLLVGTPQILLTQRFKVFIGVKLPDIDRLSPRTETPNRWLPTFETVAPGQTPAMRLDSIVNAVSLAVAVAVIVIIAYKLVHFLIFYRRISMSPDGAHLPELRDPAVRAASLLAIPLPKIVVVPGSDIFVPFTMGLRRPVVVLPRRLLDPEFLRKDELQSVLAHEFAHIKRRDYLLNWLLSVVDSLLFFNPLTKRLLSRAYEAAEEACDADAVDATGRPRALVDALLRIAKATAGPQPQPLAQTLLPTAIRAQASTLMSGKQLKERILHLEKLPAKKPRSWSRRLKQSFLVLFVLSFCLVQLNIGLPFGTNVLLFQ